MHANANKGQKNQNRAAANEPSRTASNAEANLDFVDNRAEAVQLQKLQAIADFGPQAAWIGRIKDSWKPAATVGSGSSKPQHDLRQPRLGCQVPDKSLRVFDSEISGTKAQAGVSERAGTFQRQKVFISGGVLREQVAEDAIGGDDWFLYSTGVEPPELVYVHINLIVEFMNAFPNAKFPDEPEAAQDEVVGNFWDQPENDDSSDDEHVGGLEDAGVVPDVSRILHFKNTKSPDDRTSADPKIDNDIPTKLTPEPLPGNIVEVRLMVPADPNDHFEVICLATPADPDGEIVAIKFDFNRQGYRMIYDADPDKNENRTARGLATLVAPKTVNEATQVFASVSTAGGEYREGANECGTFARNFYTELSGNDTE